MASQASTRIRATFGQANGNDASIDEQRRGWEAAAALTPLLPGITVERSSYAGVSGTWVRPALGGAGALLWLHGGGFTAGSSLTHRDLAARLAGVTELPVLLPDYRLAPEQPFPAGLDDVVRVYRALLEAGYAAHELLIGGDSAGGGLAVSALLALRDGGLPLPRAAVLFSPWLDLTLGGASMVSRAQLDPLTTRQGLERAARLYMGERDPTEPLISPIFATLNGLPPMLVQVGDHEVLLDDSRRLAERAAAAGVDVTLEVWPEMWHVWHAFAGELPEAQAALSRVGAYVGSSSPSEGRVPA